MGKNWFSILVILFVVFGLQQAHAVEIIPTPTKTSFGPNDWIEINITIDGYSGGDVLWNATKPDGTTIAGELTSFKASKKLHSIVRDAFDNQFGTWKIDYFYNQISKTINVEVEPLIVELSTDKEKYFPGETGTLFLKTNHHEPVAGNAETYVIEIQNKDGQRALHTDYTYIKAYQPITMHNFVINDLVKYNPPGIYKAVVKYYNTISEFKFSLGDSIEFVSIFVGTDKSSYLPGEVVELRVIVSKVLNSSPTLKITTPNGAIVTKSFPISSQSTKLILDDISTSEPGNYKYLLEYGGFKNTGEFVVKEIEKKTEEKPVESKNNIIIPDWVRDSAKLWSTDKMTDDRFAKGIEVIIELKDIDVPNLLTPGEKFTQKIPYWFKNNAKWWFDGKIPDLEYTTSIEFLIKKGIIRV